MTPKIKNLSLEKTPEYIELEWLAVSAKKQQALTSSDWTQLADNNLTFESQVLWNHWRDQIRAVDRKTFPTIPEAEAELDRLYTQRPTKTTVPHQSFRHKKYPLNISDLGICKSDAKIILLQYHKDWLDSEFSEPVEMLMVRKNELDRYSASGMEDFAMFPLLHAYAAVHKMEVIEAIDAIHRQYLILVELMTEMYIHREKYERQILNANSATEVIELVNRIHGY
jgi:hypothetical protein